MDTEDELPALSNEIVTAEEKKAGKDLSAEFKEVLPNAKLLADGGNLADALEMLLELEKRARLASDSPTIKAIAVEMMSLCKSKAAWNDMVEVIGTLCKRRSQKSAVITKIVEEGMKLLDETPSREVKFQLIKILRTVTEGKIFAEHERAKLTMILALMLEEDGKIAEAADTLQDENVETFGSMTKVEKAEYILEQVRMMLGKKDFIRSYILSKKINRKVLKEKNFDDVKIRFYELMNEYYTQENDTLEISKNWFEISETPSVVENEAKLQEALKNAIVFCCLSPYGNHQNDLLNRIALHKAIDKMPVYKQILKYFMKAELAPYPFPEQTEVLALPAFTSYKPAAEFKRVDDWKKALHDRVVEHNIRVVAGYYTQVESKHLASMLDLSVDDLESYISKLVGNETIFAKIDRPAGITCFVKPKPADEILSDWAGDIGNLLSMLDTTSHAINKELMLHKLV